MKKTVLCSVAFLVCLLLSATFTQAQINMPQPSPQATLSQQLGLGKVSIDYSRPSMRGRKIFGELLPYGELWRTGANAPTKFTFTEEVTIEGKKVPAGEYSLFTIPGQNEWTVILNKNPKAGTGNYKEAEDAARFTVKPQQTAKPVETFTINLGNLTNNSAVVELMWENTLIPFKVETEVDSKVMAQIQERMSTPNSVYYQAALYYMESGKDLKQAMEWMNKATANDPKFWELHQKARLQAKMKDYKGAVVTAEKSREMAENAGNKDYVRMNEKLIAEWKKAK